MKKSVSTTIISWKSPKRLIILTLHPKKSSISIETTISFQYWRVTVLLSKCNAFYCYLLSYCILIVLQVWSSGRCLSAHIICVFFKFIFIFFASSGRWTESEFPFQRIRSPSSADLGTETFCGTEGSNRDATGLGETQREIWYNPGQLQGYRTASGKTKKMKDTKNGHLRHVVSF